MWNDYFSDDKFISMIYTNIPPLINLRIEKIEISREGDRITIGFDLPTFPDKPPKKWLERGYSTAFIEIDFFDIKEVNIKSIENTYRGDIEIKKDVETDIFIVKIIGTVETLIKAGAGIIQSVKGY
ncbi:Imm50 family immunity protein [Neobacillus sp. DY30]|uniref:Imm50 family immunity protein n=1 Tax=Neobacillus sp. DY30 TaxID=3047871 RepID=UPI0024C07C40|nr:Imm50 family immunity protein [Neobacillus sp. DY30]WHY02534.1 Imm50 family immunity protein [Neobacillus sp. DY30]